MKPAARDLRISIGEDFQETYSITVKSTGLPLILTGWSAKAQVKSEYADLLPLVEFTVNILDAAGGRVAISLTRAQTRALAAQGGYWDLYLVNPAGQAQPYIAGKVAFVPTATVVP